MGSGTSTVRLYGGGAGYTASRSYRSRTRNAWARVSSVFVLGPAPLAPPQPCAHPRSPTDRCQEPAGPTSSRSHALPRPVASATRQVSPPATT